MATALDSHPASTSPFSANVLPSPAALASPRPASSSSSRLSQAESAPPPAERSAGPLNGWGRTSDVHTSGEERLVGAGLQRAHEARGEVGGGAPRSQSGSRASEAASPAGQHSSDSSNSQAIPTQYHSAITSPTSHHPHLQHRPPSVLSSSSHHHHHHRGDSDPHGLASPRSQQLSYPSSSLSTNASTGAALDYDDLLGPRRPPPGSGASISPPSSNEDDKLRHVAGSSRLQGLGFTSPQVGSGEHAAFEEWYEDDGEDDDGHSWLHVQSTARMASALPTPPASSPPSNSASLPTSSRGAPSNTTSASGGGGGIASPLSPLVPPFSPSSGNIGRGGGNPWGTAQTGARERETSWNAPLSALSPTLSYSPASRGTHSREATLSSFQPQSQQHYGPASPIPRFAGGGGSAGGGGEMLSPQAYHAAQLAPTAATFEHHDFPAVSQPMSQAGSREAFLSPPAGARGPPVVDKGGYLRSGFGTTTDRSGGFSLPLASALSAAAAAAVGASSSGSVSGAESVVGADEISTIFVVGFPDDMHEREFQNMFLFAEGFEAATLKVPAPPAREWELGGGGGSAPPSENGHGAAGVAAAFEELEQHQHQHGQPVSALPPHLSSAAAKDPYGATREAAGSPLANGSSVGGGTNGASTPLSTSGGPSAGVARKQIIGFARFRTRQQAEAARDALTGRKVDGERGTATLKAEMAKKNLHTRRAAPPSVVAVASEVASPAVLPATVPSSTSPAPPMAPAPSVPMAAPPGTGPSIPLSALDRDTLSKIASAQHMNPAVLAEIARQSMAAAAANRAAQAPEPGAAGGAADLGSRSAFEAFHSVPPQGPLVSPSAAAGLGPLGGGRRGEFYPGGGEEQQPYLQREPLPPLGGGGGAGVPLSPSMSDSSISPPHQPGHLSAYAQALAAERGGLLPAHLAAVQHQQQQQQVEDVRPTLQPLQPSYANLPGGDRERQPSFPTLPGLGGGPGGGGGAYAPYPPGPTPRQQALGQAQGLGSPPLSYAPGLGVIPRTQNPADMNAPKNTLYVGGLPAVLPSLTGPFSASHLEDSLRNAFSRCPGFKRLQFRSKSNGPIVFVEFLDTAHATRAMQELYGHTLGGLVKGGIRLSYSKNPLGVRSNGMPSGNPPPMQAPLDPLSPHGGFGPPSAFGGPPPGPPPFDNMGYDAHRRPPDPIYGETAYTSMPSLAGPASGSLGQLARSPPPLMSPLGGFSSSNPGSTGGSTPQHYAGGFSPFGLEG
ncbi:hypothetical protein JCM10213_002008 [Rhodosporidiobolus nylandii]